MENEVETSEQPCKACAGRGYRVYVYPSNKPKPAWWFTKGAHPCEACTPTPQEGEK